MRSLMTIDCPKSGYTIPALKDTAKSSMLYIVPLNDDIDESEIIDSTTEVNTLSVTCTTCKGDVPLKEFSVHKMNCSKDIASDDGSSSPDCIEERVNVDKQLSPEVEETELQSFPSLAVRIRNLKTLFPDGDERKLHLAALRSTTMDQAVEKYFSSQKDSESSSSKGFPSSSTTAPESFNSFNDLLSAYQKKVSDGSYCLKLNRDDLWRSALTFYKKAMNNPADLYKQFEVKFTETSGEEESVDAGALKIEFFELLFTELRKRCMEGEFPSLVPRKSDSINFMILGIAIAHSLLHGGPGFYGFQEWVYESIAGNTDSEHLMTLLKKDLIPLNAGTASLLKFIEELDSVTVKADLDKLVDDYIELINCSRWDPTKEITLKNKGVLLAQLVYEELVYKRQSQVQAIRDGLNVLGFQSFIGNNQNLCKEVFACNHLSIDIDVARLNEILLNNDSKSQEYECRQAFDFFQQFMSTVSKEILQKILIFATGFHYIPPWGLRKPITIRYLPDDDKKIFPKSMACFNILYLPTVHSSFASFEKYFTIGLTAEAIGFSDTS